MAWLGLLAGIVVGALLWGWNGAVVLGFLGWLAGIIAGAQKSPPPKTTVVTPRDTPATRIDRLEKRVAELELRLARFEVPVAPAQAVAPAQGVAPAQAVAPAEAGAQSLDPGLRRDDVSAQAGAQTLDPGLRRDDVSVATADDVAPAQAGAQSPPRPPAAPKPNFIVAWFTGGNAIVRIGTLILFVGLVFLLNYAREHHLVSPEWRVAGVAAFGIALLVLGWRLRERRMGYAVSLQGAGVAILYLTIFAAMRLYGLLSSEMAFVLLAAMAVFSAFIAVAQDSLALAVIGAGGGFLAPILASTGGGNHVALFGYYLMLSAGIAGIAWFKAWRALNVVGLVATALIALAWGERYYEPALFASTEPFLVVFFLLYVAIAMLFARSQPEGSDRYVDGTIVFGTPLAAFGLQAGLMRDIEFGLAYSSLAAAALYIALAALLHRLRKERWGLLAESFLALGVVFATLAIPLALDARWTSAAWALEGAAILWIGVRQDRPLARAFGLLLEVGAGVAYVNAYSGMPAGIPLVDAPFIGALLLAAAGLWTQRVLSGARGSVKPFEEAIAPFAFVWGLGWWLFAGHHEIESYLPRELRLNAHTSFFAATAIAFAAAARAWTWREARWPGIVLIPVLWVVAFVAFITQSHAFAHYGWIAWPFALAVALVLLRELESTLQERDSLAVLHAGLFLLAAVLGAWELHWVAEQETARHTAWSVASVLVVPAALLLLAMSRAADSLWPVAAHTAAYRLGAGASVLLAMGFWILYANATHDGTSDPLPYLPLLNAIDLGHVLVAACVAASALAWRRSGLQPPEPLRGRGGWVAIGVLAFVWLNAILLRSLHHWADVPYTAHAMIPSVVVQASLSIFWAVLALALMVVATRAARRPLWMVGAGLMGVVVVKLFLVDLSHIGGIERIVSFIAVGLLMLVIGYFSPVPPRHPGEPP